MKRCTSKTCIHGGKPQDKSKFAKHPTTADGLANECYDCKKVRQKAWASKKKENNDNFFKLLLG